jgi:hypothetical protein
MILSDEVEAGKSDVQVLERIHSNTLRKKSEIFAWPACFEQHGPGGGEGHE